MPPTCYWCNNYYCSVKSQGKCQKRYHSLCSNCLRLYQSGKYRYPHNLRASVDRILGIDFASAPLITEYHSSFVTSSTARLQVNQLVYHPGKPYIFKMINSPLCTAVQCWALLAEMDIYLTAVEANNCLQMFSGRVNLWRYQHAFGCRILDWWNITEANHGVADCYYRGNDRRQYPQQVSDITLPTGQPYQLSDLG